MAYEIRMPAFAAEMEEADLVRWLVSEGDRVEAGDLIAEIETDKSTVELEAPVAGIVRKLHVPAPTEGVKVGELIASLEPDAGAAAEAGTADAASASPASAAAPVEASAAQPTGAEPRSGRAAAATEAPGGADTASAPPAAPAAAQAAVPPAAGRSAAAAAAKDAQPGSPPGRAAGAAPATALARRIAAQHGVDLASVEPTGAGGRITKADVARAAAQREATPLSRMAMRSGAREAAPQPWLFEVAIDAAALEGARRTLAAAAATASQEPATPVMLRDLVAAAAARALREVPQANVAWRDDVPVVRDDAGLCIATTAAGGSVRIDGADALGIAVLAQRIAAAASAATAEHRSEAAGAADASEPALLLVDLSDSGVRRVQPVLLPPQTLVLAVGALERGAGGPDEASGRGATLHCTLAADARTTSAVTAGQWLAALRRSLEDPLSMLL